MKNKEEIKILHLSDLHNHHPMNLPSADLLIISGDYGFRPKNAPLDVLIEEFQGFNDYLGTIKDNYDKIIYSAGNHDTIFELNKEIGRKTLSNATVLLHESLTYRDYKIFASPYTPTFFNWAFNVDSGEDMQEKWKDIPLDTDILVTHCPMYGILDTVEGRYDHLGCEDLKMAIMNVKPIAHLFGHIHSSSQRGYDHSRFCVVHVNSSIMDEHYRPTGNYHLLTLGEDSVAISQKAVI